VTAAAPVVLMSEEETMNTDAVVSGIRPLILEAAA
jgi:hypothetical protein